MAQETPPLDDLPQELPVFSEEQLQGSKPILVACLRRGNDSRELEQALLDVWAAYSSVLRVCVYDPGADQDFRKRFRIMGTPTYLLMENGEERERMLGKADIQALRSFIGKTFDIQGNGE